MAALGAQAWRDLEFVVSLGFDAMLNLWMFVPVIECCEKVIRTKTSGSGAVSTADKCFVILTFLTHHSESLPVSRQWQSDLVSQHVENGSALRNDDSH